MSRQRSGPPPTLGRHGAPPSQPDQALREVLALARAGRHGEALAAGEALVRRAPHHRGARNVYGVLLLESGRIEEACTMLGALAEEAGDSASVQVNAGNAWLAAGRHEEAVRALERAVRLEPAHAVNWYGLGRAHQLGGRPDLAIGAYEEALRLDPAHLRARANLAAALSFVDRHADGERMARSAIARDPGDAGSHVNLAVALLAQGRWAEGWSAFEWRTRSRVASAVRAPFASPVWDGTPRAGATLVVHAEQGLGDTLQFARYLPTVRALGLRVVLVCQRSLVRLLQGHTAGVARSPDEVLAEVVLPIGARVPTHDAHVSISSLAHRLRCHSDAAVCASDRPYLRVSGSREALRREGDASRRLRVGLVWAGSPTHVNDRNRSIPLAAFAPLLEDPTVEWVCLQAEVPAADAALSGRLVPALADARDFQATARVLASTDLLITVDSAMAHLAGALGHPTWVLLPRLGLDWRWCLGGVPEGWGTTPWYRSVRTLRQDAPVDWRATLSQLRSALADLVAARSPAGRPTG
jgi:Flp pilus assembly protein TadD